MLGEDVHEFDAIPVLASDQLLLVRVVVRGCQEFAEDHLGDVDAVIRMLININRLSVVANDKHLVVHHRNINLLDRILRFALAETNDVVVCVYQKLVNQLVEAGIELGEHLGNELLAVHDIHFLLSILDTPDICIGKSKNVLTVRMLAILLGKIGHSV